MAIQIATTKAISRYLDQIDDARTRLEANELAHAMNLKWKRYFAKKRLRNVIPIKAAKKPAHERQ